MRFLLDNNLSPRLVDLLHEAGHDVIHVSSLGLQAADDEVVLQAARDDARVLVSADTDFGGILARERSAAPSVLLLRLSTGRRAGDIAALILANLDTVEGDLLAGAVVVFRDEVIRIRRLPLLPP